MNNLIVKNATGQSVSAKCPYLDSYERGCNHLSKPRCCDCAYVSKDDIRKIFDKLYAYEQTGLVFPELVKEEI